MLIYFLYALLILILAGLLFGTGSGQTPRRKKAYLFLCFWPTFLIPALRSAAVGTDSGAYKNIFNQVADTPLKQIHLQQEYGYILFNKFISLISENPQAIIIATSFVIALGIILFIYFNSENVWLSLFLFVAMYYFFFAMNGIRQFIAIIIVANSYYFARRKKILFFVVLIFIAFTIHKTAILGILLYLIFAFKPKLNRIILIYLVGFSSAFLIDRLFALVSIIFPFYSSYITTSSDNLGGVMPIIVYSILFLVSFLFGPRNDETFKPLLIISSITVIFGIIGHFNLMVNRAALYFDIFSILLIPCLLNGKFWSTLKPLVTSLVVVFGFVYMYYFLNYNWNHVVPYRFFWN